MYRYVIVALCIFSAVCCKPLLPGDKPAYDTSVNVNVVSAGEWIELDDSELASGYVIAELSGMTDTGYYSLELSPANIGEYFYVHDPNGPEAEYFKDKECNNVDQIDSIVRPFINEYDDECWQDVFYIDTPRTVYVFIKFSVYNSIDIKLTLSFKNGPFTDPYPDFSNPRQIAPGENADGILSSFRPETLDYFSASSIVPDTIYKVSVDYLFTESIFNPPYYVTVYLSSQNICGQHIAFDKKRLWFLVTQPQDVPITVHGFTGMRYNIVLELESKEFNPDTFEPDNGPLSPSMEILADTGSSPILSQSHTWESNQSDWVKFIPEPDASYSIWFVLEDTWYDPGITSGFYCSHLLQVIEPDGAEISKSYQYYFSEPPVVPMASSSYLDWTNTRSQPDPWFFRITPSYHQLQGKFSIRIEKN